MEISTKGSVFIENAFADLEQFFKKSFSSYFVLADNNTIKHCYPLLQAIIPPHQIITIPAGEEYKTLAACEIIWTRLTELNADRKSLLINLGGGVIGDMGGFAASCYKRGISFVQIPTTLLAMVDASVGSKTGIDFSGFKNQLGLFSEPAAVFINPVFLKTLPQRQLISGFAEVIKHYLVADKLAYVDATKYDLFVADGNWKNMIEKNVRIKQTMVDADPNEQGIRKALNFGHTLGHAVESLFLKKEEQSLSHGEAVAAGMLMESYISFKQNLLSNTELADIELFILKYFKLPSIHQSDYLEVHRRLQQDKKNQNNTIQFTLLQGIGNYSINQTVEEGLITESLDYFNSLLK